MKKQIKITFSSGKVIFPEGEKAIEIIARYCVGNANTYLSPEEEAKKIIQKENTCYKRMWSDIDNDVIKIEFISGI